MTVMKHLVMVALCVTLCGCAGWSTALGKVAQVTQWIGTVVDVASAGQKAYFDRHPNMEAERLIEDKVRQTKKAIELLDRAIAAAKSADDASVQNARANALKEYGGLRDAMEQRGILDAKPPDGGPETDAPEPKPLDLPTVAELADSFS